ncbi:tRNA lysidine(34) synthetase TilS [Gluconobacter wancherniae]|uniref:tRNA lysidine(34) synthetase TilS n=1 Tax=Gluconobacter wancherniae TaxID=1307955 RepID=UPI0031FEDD6B
MVGLPVTDLNAPIGPDEFSALMERLGPWPADSRLSPVAIAVSGGADSMALAVLALRWRQSIMALVVDHALRPESANEARLTAQRLSDVGIPVKILTLDAFPAGRMQERARGARFAAMEQAAVELGCTDLLVAHHLSDQEETVWMRYVGGSGPSGLAGMAPQSIRGRIRVVRPLLEVHPARLRATLRAAGVAWIEDPSNQNRRFERVRWRQDLTFGQRSAAHSMRAEAVRKRLGDDADLAEILAQHAQWHAEGWVSLERAGLNETVVASLIRLVGNQNYRPSRESVRRLLEQPEGALGGVLIRQAGRWGDGLIFIREERACEGAIAANSDAVWDGRWRYLGSEDGEIAGLREAASHLDARALGCPASVIRTLPGIWRDGCLMALPDLLDEGSGAPFVWAGNVPATGESVFDAEKDL